MSNNNMKEPNSDITIEIFEGSNVDVKEGTSQKTNKPYKMVKQEAYVHGLGKYPVRCNIPLDDETNPYPVGHYILQSFLAVNNFLDLTISRNLKLVPKT